MPTIENGSARLGISGRREIPQKKEDDHDHQEQRQLQGELHVIHRIANGHRAVEEHVQIHRGGSCACKAGSIALTLSTTSTAFVPGCRKTGKLNAAHAVVPGRRLVVLDAVNHAAEIR